MQHKEYVDALTGEIIRVKDIKLSELCDGGLDILFNKKLAELVAEMGDNANGAVSIKIKVGKITTVGDYGRKTVKVSLSPSVTRTSPSTEIFDASIKYVTDSGRIMAKVETGGLFIEQEPDPAPIAEISGGSNGKRKQKK